MAKTKAPTYRIVEHGENGGYIYTASDSPLFWVHTPGAGYNTTPWGIGFYTLQGARESLYYQTH